MKREKKKKTSQVSFSFLLENLWLFISFYGRRRLYSPILFFIEFQWTGNCGSASAGPHHQPVA
jgi:hypothetical protein